VGEAESCELTDQATQLGFQNPPLTEVRAG
jgi:hypothetical protein